MARPRTRESRRRPETRKAVPAVLAHGAGTAIESTTGRGASVEEFRRVSEALASTLQSFGELLVSVGSLERSTGSSLPELSKRMATPQFLSTLVTVLSPVQLGLFVKVMVRLASLGNLDLNKMTTEQKLGAGTSMKEAAADMRALLVELQQTVDQSVSPQPGRV